MARVVWDRRTDIANAVQEIPFKPLPSKEDFRPPPRIESDFTRLLAHHVPHVNWTFELIHDWYYEWTVTQAELESLAETELKRMYERGTRILRIHYGPDNNRFGAAVYDMDHFGDVTINKYYTLHKDGTYEENTEYKPEYIRGQQTAIDWKSKIGNSDMSTNFKTDYSHNIDKGDLVIREDGALFMLNWNITLHANNQATQSVECNAVIDFPTRWTRRGT